MPLTNKLCFAADGHLGDALRARGLDPAPRPAQQAYADHLATCLDTRRPAFIDAETGVGKTLGYLLPMLNHAHRGSGDRPIVVVSTANVALQRQIIETDLPIMIEAFFNATGQRLRAAMRVGKQQVIDPMALDAAVEELGTEDDRLLADDMMDWCEMTLARGELPMRQALMAEFSDRITGLHPWLSAELTGLKPESADGHAVTNMIFASLLEKCADADILVVNHHLLALHLIRPFLWSQDRAACIVVDEADRLPAIVEDMTRATVPLQRLRSLADGLARAGQDPAIADAISRLDTILESHCRDLGASNRGVVPLMQLPGPARDDVLGAVGDIRTRIGELTREYRIAHPRAPATIRDDMAALDGYGVALDRILRQAELGHLGRMVLYYSPVRRYPGIASLSDGSARIIARRLWTQPSSPVAGLLFTSATLSTLAQGDEANARRAMAGFIASCGFAADRIDAACCALIAPTHFGTMRFVRPSLDAPAAFLPGSSGPDKGPAQLNDAALTYWRAMIEAASLEGGRSLVLLPATRDVVALSQLFAPGDPRLVAQLPGLPMNMAIARFMSRPDAIWISASAWEGVSLPHAIAHVIIPRFPIRPQSFEDSVLQRYLADVTGGERAGAAVVFGRRLAEARRRLRQGIGRGIRAADDSVKIWIGDPRWPLDQDEADALLLDQPRPWSGAMLNAVPGRFRKIAGSAPRFGTGSVAGASGLQ